MSVAFRRESDDEHKEPKFDIPIPPGPNLVTRRGLAPTRFVRRLSDVPTATHPLLAACPDHGYC